jgi:hypothetical protein
MAAPFAPPGSNSAVAENVRQKSLSSAEWNAKDYA